MKRFIYFFLLAALSGSVSAQQLTVNHDYSVSSSDSAKSHTNRCCKGCSVLKTAILPLSLVTAGVIIESLPSDNALSKGNIQQHVQNNLNHFHTSVDNFTQFVPLGALFGFSLAGVKGRNDFTNQAILTAKSELLMNAIVYSMKHFIHDMRPDGSTDNSMPSGHTAQAFVSATLLDMEYRDSSPWISVGGYFCAATTGVLRVANNRHWASDVLVGAGIGIASVKLVYLTHQHRWGNKPQCILLPTVGQNGGGVAFAMKF